MKMLMRPLMAAVVTLVAVLATGSPAFAAEHYQYPTASGNASYTVDTETYFAYCEGSLAAIGGQMNTERTKRIRVYTTSSVDGCVLQVFPFSTSNQYDAFVAQPNGATTTHSFWKAVHRIRVCQSGDDGNCSPYMRWNGTLL